MHSYYNGFFSFKVLRLAEKDKSKFQLFDKFLFLFHLPAERVSPLGPPPAPPRLLPQRTGPHQGRVHRGRLRQGEEEEEGVEGGGRQGEDGHVGEEAESGQTHGYFWPAAFLGGSTNCVLISLKGSMPDQEVRRLKIAMETRIFLRVIAYQYLPIPTF